MIFQETSLPGVKLVRGIAVGDDRGCLQKYFQKVEFQAHGLCTDYAEDLYTISRRGVLRGMHFQTPPHGQVKLVCCASGDVLDVVLDIRAGSPSFGRWATFELNGGKREAIYLPEGIAHGFLVRSDEAIMLYKLSSPFVKQSDAGVHYASFGYTWPEQRPLVSARDQNLSPWPDYRSPFQYEQGRN